MKSSVPVPALLLYAVLSGCGPADHDAASGADPSIPPAPTPGNPVPDWSARTLDGDRLELADLRGRVVLLNVWATWCAPCLREMPALDRLQRAHDRDDLLVIGVSIDRATAESQVRDFVAELDLSFTILLDPDQMVMERLRVIGVPETFLIDRDGIIAHRWIGEFDPDAPADKARIDSTLTAL